eukprot:5228801-Pleurochrysis_carterae.AAC.1
MSKQRGEVVIRWRTVRGVQKRGVAHKLASKCAVRLKKSLSFTPCCQAVVGREIGYAISTRQHLPALLTPTAAQRSCFATTGSHAAHGRQV